jgi:hypothetical protein
LEALPKVVVACPRRDLMRIWPLPVVDPRFEDWREEPKERKLNG